jgi:thiamine-phosphate pyrophosphorylase
MLIVISYPTSVPNEAKLINQLFDEGLTLFHLRKAEYDREQIKELLEHIDPLHYSKIVLHQHHDLAKEFGIKRLHFTEANRKTLTETDLGNLKTSQICLSTSVHSVEDYLSLSSHFNYSFFGPVYNSISKKDRKAMERKEDIKGLKKTSTKLIALGGISIFNLDETLNRGFDGLSVLGSIWESKDPLVEYIKLHKACAHCEITL